MGKSKRSQRLLNAPGWDTHYLTQNPIFDGLMYFLGNHLPKQWPTLDWLNRYCASEIKNRNAIEHFEFIEQDEAISAIGYEQHIAQHHQVPTRLSNWHDFFNAACWASFPLTKFQLNKLHINESDKSKKLGQTNRSRSRDLLTLIDESGILIAYSSERHLELNQTHDWSNLFVREKNAWMSQLKPFIIGHGLYEQCVRPYIGLTAKAHYIKVEPTFFTMSLKQQYQCLDAQLAQQLIQLRGFPDSKPLPLPILGIPGWYPNQDEGFYSNTQYFRPLRQQ